MSGKSIREWEGEQRISGHTSHAVGACQYSGKLYLAYKHQRNHSIWINSFDGDHWQGEEAIQGRTNQAPVLTVFNDRLYIAYKGWNNDTLWLNSFDGRNWAGEQQISGSPHHGPALTVYNGRLYVAWDQEDHSIWINSFDGHSWGTPQRLAGRTNDEPSLAVFNNSLYLAYKGWNNNTLWINRFDGSRWEGEWQLPGQTNLSPSLAAYRGYLFIGYKGYNNQSIWLNAMRWIRWEGEIGLGGESTVNPRLAVFDKKLYLIYRDSDFHICLNTFDGLSWEGEHQIWGSTNRSPAATVYNGSLYVAQRRSDHRIRLSHSMDGRDWSEEELLQGKTNEAPALATWNGRLCLAYKGWNDHSLWFNFYNGSAWAGEARLIGKTSHQPAMVSHKGLLFIAYKGWNNNSIWINHCSWDDDAHTVVWSGERRVTGSDSDLPPVLVSFRGKICLLYKKQGTNRFHWRCGYWDGNPPIINWEPEEAIPGESDQSPAAAVFGDYLMILYKGLRHHDLYFNIYDKRCGWLGVYNSTLTGGLTDRTPALTCKEGSVWAVYKGWDNEIVMINSYRLIQAWQPAVPAGFNPADPRDANHTQPTAEGGALLNHCFETTHLQIFWNESEPDESVSPADARLVADSLECAWNIFANRELAEGAAFTINLNTSQYDDPHNRQKLPVWIRGVGGGNGFAGSYRLDISCRGGITGAATLLWGPHGYAGGTAPHELGHCMNKSYSYHFNSGGSGLRWINEGIPDVYRAITDPYYPGTEGAAAGTPESLSPSKLIGHHNLSNGSLLLTSYQGRRFWFDMIRAYTQIHDRAHIHQNNWGFYEWSEIPFGLRESYRHVAESAGLDRLRRLPGRDILLALQESFGPCFPLGQNTSVCAAGSSPTPASAGGTGCVPAGGELYRLVPLAMDRIDLALAPFWTRVEAPQLKYRAFREFLERNFLAPNYNQTTEVRRSGTQFRLKSLGAHYHVLTEDSSFTTGATLTITITPAADLPDNEWAVAAFNFSGGDLVPIVNWQIGSGTMTLTINTGTHQHPVVIVAGLYLGFTFNSNTLSASTGNYSLTTVYS